jgi:uncharacterized protein
MSSALPEPIDIHALTQVNGRVSGLCSAQDLPRLADLTAGESTRIEWAFEGSSLLRADGSRQARADLFLQGLVVLPCVRCLQPLEHMLDEHRRLRFVRTEEQAATEDAQDEDFDVLVASRSFDLAGLIEDEVLLALPGAPRHSACGLPAEISQELSWKQGLGDLRSQVADEKGGAKD